MKNKRQKELEMKEENLDSLIKEMAKNLIEENEGYIPKDIAEASIKEIDGTNEVKETKKRRTRKGA